MHKAAARLEVGRTSPSTAAEERTFVAREALERLLLRARGAADYPSTTLLVRNYRRALAERLIEIMADVAGEFIDYRGR